MLLEFSECNEYIQTNKKQCYFIRTVIPYPLGFLCCRHLTKLCCFCRSWNDLRASCFFSNEILFFPDSPKDSSAFLSKPSHLELGTLSLQFPGFHGTSLLPLPVIYILPSIIILSDSKLIKVYVKALNTHSILILSIEKGSICLGENK